MKQNKKVLAIELRMRIIIHADALIAQSAEHKTENLGVVGSIPTEATIVKKTNYKCNERVVKRFRQG